MFRAVSIRILYILLVRKHRIALSIVKLKRTKAMQTERCKDLRVLKNVRSILTQRSAKHWGNFPGDASLECKPTTTRHNYRRSIKKASRRCMRLDKTGDRLYKNQVDEQHRQPRVSSRGIIPFVYGLPTSLDFSA